MFEEETLYITSPSGDLKLVEIYENGQGLIIKIGDFSVEIEKESAFDLADAILLAVNRADILLER